ncbi:uncharacterized protein Dwil_GK27236 [Drosophila willistoni]|uniref:Uncharacterized protein n=1 Tax=Drosophila willistoni TaxID=7260 RepID=A0A0Q9WT92_DROWI|nr:uncharacterized protein Dwil_GK27236 [Drosophila willistoni]
MGCGRPSGGCSPRCGPCGPRSSCCTGCSGCSGCGPCGPGCCGPCSIACCGPPPCAVVSYRLSSGPVGPVLPCMECTCTACCPSNCAPPFYFVPNKCACCWEWGRFGPFY